jgi:V-type H+-transporting ATPase subunit H
MWVWRVRGDALSRIVKLFGAKEKVMDLIEHGNPDVARYALQCVSKIMVQKWEFVSR